jgi:haloacetate dehalogenase
VVARVVVLDVVPTGDVWRRADGDFTRGYWHWGFLALPPLFPSA